MFNLYEIKCTDYTGMWFEYYYCHATGRLNEYKRVLTNAVPDKVRLVIDDRYSDVTTISRLNPISFLYRKYIKRRFHWGRRINWEKEKI